MASGGKTTWRARRPVWWVAVGSSAVLAVALAVGTVTALRPGPSQFRKEYFYLTDGRKYEYLICAPRRPPKGMPVVVFLNGYGPAMLDSPRKDIVGLADVAYRLVNEPKSVVVPASEVIMVFPTSWGESWEEGSTNDQLLDMILSDVKSNFEVDTRRIIITGISGGGSAVWQQAEAHPGKWAGAIVVCGSPMANDYNKAALTSFCVWHDTDDPIYSIKSVRKGVAAMKIKQPSISYTETTGYRHLLWDKAYNSSQLWDWLVDARCRTH